MPPISRNPQGLQLIDPVLTNLALVYRYDGAIYDQVVANMPVSFNSGQYPVWSREDLLRKPIETRVADRAETPEIDLGYSLRDYVIHNHRLKVSITPEERQIAHPALRFEQMKLNFLLDQMAIGRESRLAAKLRKTTNGGGLTLGSTPGTKWDANGATIEANIKAAKMAIYNATGQMADTVIVPFEVAYVISQDPGIREILKYTVDGRQLIANGEAILPERLHGMNVVVVGGKVNTARSGAPEQLDELWGDHVRLIKRGVDNAWGNPATVYCLRGTVNATQEGSSRRTSSTGGGFALVDRWAEADPPVDYIRAWEKVEEHLVAPDIGYEIANVLS